MISQCKKSITAKEEIILPQINRVAIEFANTLLERGNNNQKKEGAALKEQSLRSLVDFFER